MSVEPQVIDETAAGTTVFVYEAPVRIWHWLNALSIGILAVTGYLPARCPVLRARPAITS